jgi:hypothetical protein
METQDSSSTDVPSTDANLLAKLLEMVKASEGLWPPEELGAILQHQLASPLGYELGQFDADIISKLGALAVAGGLKIETFGDLLHHRQPPVDVLEAVKNFAKSNIGQTGDALPVEIARVLYFVSIAVALAKCGRRITELDDEQLRRGFAWSIKQDWVDDQTRGLLKGGLDRVAGST